jgi:hypothetical protein
MTAAQQRSAPQVVSAAPIAEDAEVLPAHLVDGRPDRGPRFGDMVWDLWPFLRRTARQARLDFTCGLADDIAVHTAKEYLYSRLRRVVPGRGHSGVRAQPLTVSGMIGELQTFKAVVAALRDAGADRLAEVTAAHLETVRAGWDSVETAAIYIAFLRHLADHGPFLTTDRLTVSPWPGRTANAVAGRQRAEENRTQRIPEAISGPLISAAVFYVQTASGDILAALREVTELEAARTRLSLTPGQAKARLDGFIARRRQQGRGIPALPVFKLANRPGAAITDGVVQAANYRTVALLAGVTEGSCRRHQRLLATAGRQLGFEAGGLDTPIAPWPATGQPWRPRLDPASLYAELYHLRTACWVVIAYLSGMRDEEVRELRRDCAFTEPGDDGRTRYKLRGRVYKGRSLSGDQAEWVVLDVVHQAVAVLLQVNDDPTHLFGYHRGDDYGYVLLGSMPKRLGRFRDHLNDLFSTPEARYIPSDTSTLTSADTDDAQTVGPDQPGVPWAFTTRQFRRTLAWHIAHQPFGIVAGARQYKHARHLIFSGYAGTSASGFAAEVAAEEATARLDYAEDLYRDWNDGGRSTGGAGARIDAEFTRIRRELGDLPGVIASPARLRTMLRHLTTTLHPGILNDCFYNSATAVCRKQAKALGRPLPLHNLCLSCPNARRSSVHLPRLTLARDQARQALADAQADGRQLPPLQRQALDDHLTGLDRLIGELHAGPTDTQTSRSGCCDG